MRFIHIDVLLASAYAIFLTLIAAGLERIARHSHERTHRIRTAGFSYHSGLDVWRCPNGKHLHPIAVSGSSRVVRYRGQAEDCNACPIKKACTGSGEGRVIEVQADSWIESELRRFHRGLSLTLLLLADLILAAMILSYHTLQDELLTASLFVGIAGVGFRLSSEFLKGRRDKGDRPLAGEDQKKSAIWPIGISRQ